MARRQNHRVDRGPAGACRAAPPCSTRPRLSWCRRRQSECLKLQAQFETHHVVWPLLCELSTAIARLPILGRPHVEHRNHGKAGLLLGSGNATAKRRSIRFGVSKRLPRRSFCSSLWQLPSECIDQQRKRYVRRFRRTVRARSTGRSPRPSDFTIFANMLQSNMLPPNIGIARL